MNGQADDEVHKGTKMERGRAGDNIYRERADEARRETGYRKKRSVYVQRERRRQERRVSGVSQVAYDGASLRAHDALQQACKGTGIGR